MGLGVGRMSTEPKAGEGRVYNYGSLGLARPARCGDLPLGWVLEAWRRPGPPGMKEIVQKFQGRW